MKLKLKVELPSSADHDEAINYLVHAAVAGEGITITMPDGSYKIDVILDDVERLAAVGSEATS